MSSVVNAWLQLNQDAQLVCKEAVRRQLFFPCDDNYNYRLSLSKGENSVREGPPWGSAIYRTSFFFCFLAASMR